ncbi:MAG: hypothetical protein KKH98_14085, partial [Spirochaetes bacterium]|nr:hypothetical protein [Spirochaetota bacterium]
MNIPPKIQINKDITLKKSMRVLANENLSVLSETGKGVYKTLKCGLFTDPVDKKKRFKNCLTIEQKQKLDAYIDRFDQKKQQILEDFYHYFEKGVWDFLIYCARRKDTSVTEYTEINDIPSIETDVRNVNGDLLVIKAYQSHNTRKNEYAKRISWFATDKNTDDGCHRVGFQYNGKVDVENIDKNGKIKTDKQGNPLLKAVNIDIDNYKAAIFKPELFTLQIDAQELGNRMSFFYMTEASKNGKPTAACLKYKKQGICIKGICDDLEYDIKEALREKVSGVITSFAQKLMDKINEVKDVFEAKNKLISQIVDNNVADPFLAEFRKETWVENKELFTALKDLQLKQSDLKLATNAYSSLSREYNQLMNIYIQSIVSKMLESAIKNGERLNKEDEEDKLRKKYLLKRLKGVPSFPQIKASQKDQKKPDEIVEIIISDSQASRMFNVFDELFGIENRIHDFHFLTGKVTSPINDINSGQIGEKKKWEIIREGLKDKFIYVLYTMLCKNPTNIAGRKMFSHAYYLITLNPKTPNSEIVSALIEFAGKKMVALAPHLKPDTETQFDHQSRRIFADYGRFVISLVALQMKKEGRNKDARKLELKIDEIMGDFKGSVFDRLNKKQSNILGLSGFDFKDSGAIKGACLIFRNTEAKLKSKKEKPKDGTLTEWYLGINMCNTILFEGPPLEKKKINEYEKDVYFAFGAKKDRSDIFKLSEKKDDELLLIPLDISKRQVREYFL